MDAFFASVEQHDRPELRGRPVIVANSPLSTERLREIAEDALKQRHPPEFIKGIRGVVSSASYEVRAFGVRSAMPLARALVLCPEAEVLPGHFDRYREVSHQLREIWADFSPVVEPLSLDEAFLDLTGSETSEGPVRKTAERLKARMVEDTGLTGSVGVAPNRLVAKIASDLKKPDGLVIVRHGEEARLLAPLPVRALPGVGPRTAEALYTLDISTIGDIVSAGEPALASRLGVEHAAELLRHARGIDETPVLPPGEPKSMSRETTLAEDTGDVPTVKSMLGLLADHVAWQLRQDGYKARCVVLKLRLLPAHKVRGPEGSGFGRLITRQVTLFAPTDSGRTLHRIGCQLLDGAAQGTGLGAGREVVRLVGVGATSLVRVAESLLPLRADTDSGPHGQAEEKDRRLNESLDTIRKKFGFSSITLGSGLKHYVSDDQHED